LDAELTEHPGCDRHGSFEPQLIPKHQTRWTGFDDKIISPYARGMTVREGAVRAKAVYPAIGITMSGNKDVLGLCLAQTEAAKFWLQVVTEMPNRGVKDIFIA
jgi:putative transposase